MPGSGRSSSNKGKIEEELLRQQRLEEENLAKEQAEELEKRRREEKIRIELEKTEALKVLKPIQHEHTLNQLDKPLSYIKKTFEQEKYDFEFNRFMQSGKRPDANEMKSINTYISLLKEYGTPNMNDVLEDIKLILSLLAEINVINEKYPPEDDGDDGLEHRQINVLNLQELIVERYDDATLKILQEATLIQDSDSGNLEKIYKGMWERILIWGNLVKNPRMTNFEFPSEGIKVEIPKTIALADVGIRILITKYDHISNQCSTFYPKKPAPAITETSEEIDGEKEGEENQEEGQEEGAEGEEKNETEAQEKLPEVVVEEVKTEDEHNKEGEEGSKEDGSEKYESEEQGGTADVKSSVKSHHETEDLLDDDMLDADVIDLRQFTRLGEIYDFEMMKLPPQPIIVNKWTLTQITDEPLISLSYPEDVTIKEPPKEPSESEELKEKSQEENEQEEEEEAKVLTPPPPEPTPTIGITMKMPTDVMFYEEPQVARWDSKDQHWKTSGISKVIYDDINKMISFETDNLGKFCLLQDTHLNMPYQSWQLHTTGKNTAIFTVIAACSENVFEIKGTKCRLLKPEGGATEEFSAIYEKWMIPEDLIKLMKDSGNNIFPNEDSVNFVSVVDKKLDCNWIYDQMAYLSPSFGFEWSRFANDVRDDEFIFQVIPIVNRGSEESMSGEENPATFVVKPDRCYKLAVTEQEIRLNYEPAKGCEYQTDLLNATKLTKLPSDDKNKTLLKKMFKRIENGDLEMVATIRYLLHQTNVLTFS